MDKRNARSAKRSVSARLTLRLLLTAVFAAALSGCLLISGEQTSLDLAEGGGNVLTTFVSAEGGEVRAIETGAPGAELQVIAVVESVSGDLQLSLIDADGSVAFTVAARPAVQVTRSGGVRADEQGLVRYRVQAQGARDGMFQLFVQP